MVETREKEPRGTPEMDFKEKSKDKENKERVAHRLRPWVPLSSSSCSSSRREGRG